MFYRRRIRLRSSLSLSLDRANRLGRLGFDLSSPGGFGPEAFFGFGSGFRCFSGPLLGLGAVRRLGLGFRLCFRNVLCLGLQLPFRLRDRFAIRLRSLLGFKTRLGLDLCTFFGAVLFVR